MPFTPTHALAALPIAKIWFPPGYLAALIVGTMTPDWPLYVNLSPPYAVTHSFPGLFTACLPIGVALSLAYLFALKRALFDLLPVGLKARVATYVETRFVISARSLVVLAFAVLIGAATHLVWDAFTHHGSWGVALFPVLGESWLNVGDLPIAGYAVLQHGSSLIGFPVFILIFVSWYRRASIAEVPPPRISPSGQRFWRFLLTVAPSVLMLITVLRCLMSSSLHAVIYTLIEGATQTGFTILLLLAIYATYFAWSTRHGEKREPVAPNEPPAEL